MDSKTVEIFVPLLDEGVPTVRGTMAIPLGKDLYRVLPTPNYDPEDEIWEFLPDSIVRCVWMKGEGERYLQATEVQGPDGNFIPSGGAT